jgi:ribonuclease J
MSLKFIALSGTISVTENLYVYEYEDQMMVVDCGVGFPDIEMRGVDLVIPDFSYIVRNKDKLRGIVVSQGHEDHIGALPFLLKEVQTTIWAAPLVTSFLDDKFKDRGIGGVKINTFNPINESFNIGVFKVHPFRVTHSVPDTVGFAIDTPEGRVFHVPEHKMQQEPVDNMPFDKARAQQLASKKVLFLASDCLGANKPGYTIGERQIEENIFKIANRSKAAVFFTAISSNIGRFQQAIDVAIKTGRKAVYVGRSVQKKCEMAQELGYLKYPKDAVISLGKARNLPRNKIMYIVAGCYGQVGSSLYRISNKDHDRLHAEAGDTLIFSADPAPPYTKESENYIIDNFIDMGVDVHYYDLDEGLYVSGHGSQEDILELFKITNPDYFIPIGGAIRFMHSYKKLAQGFGAKESDVFELKPGESVIFRDGKANRGKKIHVKEVLVDGLGIGDVGRVVLSDRKTLSQHGTAVVVIKIDPKSKKVVGKLEIVSRGFVFEKSNKKLLNQAVNRLEKRIKRDEKLDKKNATIITLSFLQKFFFEETGRRPMIIPVIVEV